MNQWEDQATPADPLVRFDGPRLYHLMAGQDEQNGGALLYFQLNQPLGITGSNKQYPCPMAFLAQAR